MALLVPTGLDMASTYHHDGLAACIGRNPPNSCDLTIQEFTTRFEPLANLLAWLTLVPGLIGVLLAAPFVLELENGTTRLAWTQSITRRRWITCKLAVIVGAALLAALVLTLAMTWWHAPFVRVHGRMENSVYDAEGIALSFLLVAPRSGAMRLRPLRGPTSTIRAPPRCVGEAAERPKNRHTAERM